MLIVTAYRGRHISKTEPARLLCELKRAFSPGRRPVSARSLRTPPRFLGIGRRSEGTETCSQLFSDFPMANFEVEELVNRSPVDRSGIGKHSIDIRAAIRRFKNIFGFRIRTEVSRAARPPHEVPTILPVSRPTLYCTKSGVLRAHSVLVSIRRRAASTGPAGLLLSTQKFGPNSVAVTWQLHRRTPAGRRAEPARESAGCWAGIDRPIDP